MLHEYIVYSGKLSKSIELRFASAISGCHTIAIFEGGVSMGSIFEK